MIANFSSLDREIQNVPFFSDGNWFNALESNNNLNVTGDTLPEYFIEAKTAVIYSNQNWSLKLDKNRLIPEKNNIIQSYPNPFNGQINIIFSSNSPNSGKINIYDVSGKLVFNLKQIKLSQGDNLFKWDAKSNNGSALPTGLYIISIDTGTKIKNHKILYLK